jgi:hypothetical protein
LSASINPGILIDAATPASHPDRRALLILIVALQIIPFFVAPTGIVINYDPDRAVRYDLNGTALEILRGAVRLGETRVAVAGKSVGPVFEFG